MVCIVAHGIDGTGITHCFECREYPCSRYDGIDQRDSLISHRNQLKDMDRAREGGIGTYHAEQRERAALLRRLLDGFDDGGRDVFFCLAANMLQVPDLRDAIGRAEAAARGKGAGERADIAEGELRRVAEARGVPLHLRTWEGPW